MADEDIRKWDVTFVTGTRIQQRVVVWPSESIDSAIRVFLDDELRSRRARETRVLYPDYVIFFWEGEWRMINQHTRQRRYFPSKEAAEMVAIHRG